MLSACAILTAGISAGPALALAFRAVLERRSLLTLVAAGLAILATAEWVVSWVTWVTDGTAAIGEPVVIWALEAGLAALVLGGLSWLLFGLSARRVTK